MCSDATAKNCITDQGKTFCLLFSAALQNRLKAALCHCNYTYGDLLFLQVLSDATAKQCSTDQGKMACLMFSAALQNRFKAALSHCNYTYRDLLFI